jgi:hypothetical protein
MSDKFEETIKAVEQQIAQHQDYIIIKQGDKECRLFKSLSNGRLPDESFDEYKLRQKINRKMINLHKKGAPAGSDI